MQDWQRFGFVTFSEEREAGRLLDRIQYEGMNLVLRSRRLRVAPAVARGPAPSSSQGVRAPSCSQGVRAPSCSQGVRAPSCRRWLEGKEQGGHHDPAGGRESCSSTTEGRHQVTEESVEHQQQFPDPLVSQPPESVKDSLPEAASCYDPPETAPPLTFTLPQPLPMVQSHGLVPLPLYPALTQPLQPVWDHLPAYSQPLPPQQHSQPSPLLDHSEPCLLQGYVQPCPPLQSLAHTYLPMTSYSQLQPLLYSYPQPHPLLQIFPLPLPLLQSFTQSQPLPPTYPQPQPSLHGYTQPTHPMLDYTLSCHPLQQMASDRQGWEPQSLYQYKHYQPLHYYSDYSDPSSGGSEVQEVEARELQASPQGPQTGQHEEVWRPRFTEVTGE